jgi:hypothetical protein
MATRFRPLVYINDGRTNLCPNFTCGKESGPAKPQVAGTSWVTNFRCQSAKKRLTDLVAPGRIFFGSSPHLKRRRILRFVWKISIDPLDFLGLSCGLVLEGLAVWCGAGLALPIRSGPGNNQREDWGAVCLLRAKENRSFRS